MQFFVGLFVFLISLSSLAQSKVHGILINSDSMSRDSETQTIELEGHVQIIFKNQTLTANRATIFLLRKEFIAEGDVMFMTLKGTIGGEKVLMNYDNNIGTIYNGYVQSGAVLIEGEIIEKTGDDTYATIRSEYTACSTCPPGWSFYGGSIQAKLEGYAFIKNALLKFSSVPVFWLPYLIVPLKNQRQTGLLTPSYSKTGKGGLAISLPFFWAISRSQDATLTMRNYELRGLKSLLNYRYVLNNESSGEFNFENINDKVFSSDERLRTFRTDQENSFRRFLADYSHYWVLPDGWVNRVNLKTTSDLQYLSDYDDEFKKSFGDGPTSDSILGDSAQENRVSIAKNTEDFHFSVDSTYYTNLLQSHPTPRINDSVHRLPEIRLSSVNKKIGASGLLFRYDIEYTNFARNGFAYDDLISSTDVNGNTTRDVANSCYSTPVSDPGQHWDKRPDCQKANDGQFNTEQDLIRSGQRLIVEPQLALPFKAGDYVNIMPTVALRETHYSFGIDEVPDITQRYLRMQVSAKTYFSRIYGTNPDVYSTRYRHEIQPEIISTSLPWLEHPDDHPFFGSGEEIPFYTRESLSDTDFNGENGVQFDFKDKLFNRNLVTFKIGNKLMRKRWFEKLPVYDQVVSFSIAQTYDAYLKSRDRNPWSDIEGILKVNFEQFETLTTLNHFPTHNLTNVSSRLKYILTPRQFVQLTLTRDYKIPEQGEVNINTRTDDYNLSFGTSPQYFEILAGVVYDANPTTANERGNTIKSWAYNLKITPPGDCWSIYYSREQVIAGENKEYLFFEFLFDGKTGSRVSKN